MSPKVILSKAMGCRCQPDREEKDRSSKKTIGPKGNKQTRNEKGIESRKKQRGKRKAKTKKREGRRKGSPGKRKKTTHLNHLKINGKL